MSRSGPTGAPTISKSSTFAEFAGWIDYYESGLGEQFIAWVPASSTTPSVPVQLNSASYGKGPNNSAYDWFSAWFAQTVVGPGIGDTLAKAIGGISGKIPTILQATGAGIGQVPGAKTLSGLDAIGSFFDKLGQASTWIRVGEVLLGIVLLAVGLARITGTQNLVSQVVKARIP